MAIRKPATSFENQWEGRLIASPSRVRPGESMTLIVVATHPQFSDLHPERFSEFHLRCLRFSYSSDDPRLRTFLETYPGAHGNPFTIARMPELPAGDYQIRATVTPIDHILDILSESPSLLAGIDITNWPPTPEHLVAPTTITMVANYIEGQVKVALQRTASAPTKDQALWAAIRNRTAAVSFPRYKKYIDHLLCHSPELSNSLNTIRNTFAKGFVGTVDKQLSIFGPYAYGVLKLATQAFLTLEAGVVIRDQELFDEEQEPVRFDDPSINLEELEKRLVHYLVQPGSHESVLPYLNRIVTAFVSLDRGDDVDRNEVLPYCDGIMRHRLTAPSMIELIWSYWQEEGMLVQTMNAIARRFQNRRGSAKDPLGELEFDSLRPLNNLLWGYIQDEHNRLTVPRRAHEYRHQYGLSLEGKAVGDIYPADNRSKFIEAFHNLLYRTDIFYREDRDTTMIADAFPLLNALQDVHLILAEGAHNQFGDLTWTARGEMLMTQWMLARPEMREFLRGRYMVPYQEPWMGAVDAMKRLQGWSDTSITHFHDLAFTGERILLSIRWGNWSDNKNIEEQAKNWARNCKPEIQRYLYGYRTVTGVDPTDTRDAAMRFIQPSVLLRRRLGGQRTTSLPPSEPGLRALGAPAAAPIAVPSKEMARLPRPGTRADV
jgi:hypothetical protein